MLVQPLTCFVNVAQQRLADWVPVPFQTLAAWDGYLRQCDWAGEGQNFQMGKIHQPVHQNCESVELTPAHALCSLRNEGFVLAVPVPVEQVQRWAEVVDKVFDELAAPSLAHEEDLEQKPGLELELAVP